MIEQDNKPWNLKDAVTLEEEVHDWDDYVGTVCVRTAQRRDEAQKNGDYALAQKLDKEWSDWVDVKDLGHLHAADTELGRQTLAYIRQRRERLKVLPSDEERQEKEKQNGDDL